MKTKNTYLSLLFIVIAFQLYGQEGRSYGDGKTKHRLSIGVIKSFYQNDPKLTINTKAKAGFDAAYKVELYLSRTINFVIGLEYQHTGLTFNGYYKKPGYSYLYDGTFPYTHDVTIQELQLPLLLRYAFNSEKAHSYTPYFMGGIAARYIFSSYSVITNDSTGLTPFDAKDNIDFENQLLMNGLNSCFQLCLGLQHNNRHYARYFFFEVNYKYNISRIYYDGNVGSNNLNIRDSQLIFSIGLRL